MMCYLASDVLPLAKDIPIADQKTSMVCGFSIEETCTCFFNKETCACSLHLLLSSLTGMCSQSVKGKLHDFRVVELKPRCPNADKFKKTNENKCNDAVVSLTRDGKGFFCTGCGMTINPTVQGKLQGSFFALGAYIVAAVLTLFLVFYVHR